LANRIFYGGQPFLTQKLDIAVLAIFISGVTLSPLFIFSSQLINLRQKSLREYGALAFKYADAFHRKWIQGKPDSAEPLLGSADIQSLADMANSYQVIKSMRLVPFTRKVPVILILSILLPISPLVLTILPLDQLIDRALQLLF
jgi:hypothetical protein